MNINISNFNSNISIRPLFKSNKNASEQRKRVLPQQKNDSFELSIGYVNDIHGQTNNMIRILSGLKGDIKLSAGDNDIGDEKNIPTHSATGEFLKQADITATALGNHELDAKQSNVEDNIKNLKTKILSCNFKKTDDWESREDNKPEYGRAALDELLIPSSIVEVKGEKIGLIGISPVDMFERTTHPAYHKDCYVEDLEPTIEEIQKQTKKLKEQGINKIILLSHVGHKKDQIIAQNTDGIDVIVGGHTHELIKDIKKGENFFYSKSGEPVIMTEAGKDGAYFGLLNLTFDKNGIITKAQNNLAETRLFHKNLINQTIFNNYMGKPEKVGYILQAPPPPTSLLEENPHANFVCDAMKDITNSEIAIWNNSGIRNFFHEGEIDSRDIKDIAPFFDKISVSMVSEKLIVDGFKAALKTSYESHGNKPGLLAVSGLEYGVNKKGDLTFINLVDNNGKKTPIDINNPRENKLYKLVTDEYMMSSGADYLKLAEPEECLEIYPYDKDVMTCQYIKALNRPIVINQTGRIKFED